MSHLDRDFAYMNLQENELRTGHKAPAPSKHVKQYVSVGEDYIPGGPVYRAMPYPPPPPPDDDLPLPPPPLSQQDQYIHNDAGSFPPPPPDSSVHSYHTGRYYEVKDDYNAAPPLNVNVGISHSTRTHYSDYGPGQTSAKSPYESRSDFTTSTTTYHGRQQSGSGGNIGYNAPHSPQHISQPPSYNWGVPELRNIPIQVRGQPPPPASSPTHVYSSSNVSSTYADVSSLPPNRGGQISPQAMPSSAAYQKSTVPSNTYGSISPTSRPSRSMPLSIGGKYASGPQQSLLVVAKPDKEAEVEVDALTNMLLHNMENSSDPDFFGMCAKCNRKVMGESNGCTAMNLVYHITCFTCVSCNLMLQGKSFYSMENKPYCDECYFNTLEKCSVCSKPITDRLLRATGKPYHADCFVCVICGKSLDGIPFTVDATSQIHCIEDFHRKFAPRCCVCHLPIMPESGQDETVRVVAMDRSFHVQCYRCEDCGSLLSSEAEGRGCYPLDDHILCKNCNAKRIQALTTKMATEL